MAGDNNNSKGKPKTAIEQLTGKSPYSSTKVEELLIQSMSNEALQELRKDLSKSLGRKVTDEEIIALQGKRGYEDFFRSFADKILENRDSAGYEGRN